MGFDELFGPFESPTFTKLNLRLQGRQLALSREFGARVPKYAVCADTKVLQDKPNAEFVVLIMQAKCTRA